MRPFWGKSLNVWEDPWQDYIEAINELVLVDPRERLFQDYIINPFLQLSLPEFDIVPVDDKLSEHVHDYSKYCGKFGKYVLKKDSKDPGVFKIQTQTPDLCVAKGWKWNNRNNNNDETEYIATVEIKPPSLIQKKFSIAPGYKEVKKKNGKILKQLFENKGETIAKDINETMLKIENGKYIYEKDKEYKLGIMRQIGIHLRGINKVIATDGIRWLFFYKNKEGQCKHLSTIDLGKRIFQKNNKKYEFARIEWDIEEYVEKGIKETVGPCFSSLIKQIQEFCTKDVSQFEEKDN